LFVFNELAHFLIPVLAIRIWKVRSAWPAVCSAGVLPTSGSWPVDLPTEFPSRATSQTSRISMAQGRGSWIGYLCKNGGPVPGLRYRAVAEVKSFLNVSIVAGACPA
jgi:hypothetical protein